MSTYTHTHRHAYIHRSQIGLSIGACQARALEKIPDGSLERRVELFAAVDTPEEPRGDFADTEKVRPRARARGTANGGATEEEGLEGDGLGQQEAARLASEQAALPKVESKERGSSRSASVGWSGAGQTSGVAKKRAREGERELCARGWDRAGEGDGERSDGGETEGRVGRNVGGWLMHEGARERARASERASKREERSGRRSETEREGRKSEKEGRKTTTG